MAGDLEACELQWLDPTIQPARQPWAGNHGIIRNHAGHRFRSGAPTKRQVFTVCERKWGISSTWHSGSLESSLLIFFLSQTSCGFCCALPQLFSVDSLWMIYWAWDRDNAHTTNLSAEHIDTWVCHYPLLTLLTYVSIWTSWQLTKLQKFPQINPQGFRAHSFFWTPDNNKTCTRKLIGTDTHRRF